MNIEIGLHGHSPSGMSGAGHGFVCEEGNGHGRGRGYGDGNGCTDPIRRIAGLLDQGVIA